VTVISQVHIAPDAEAMMSQTEKDSMQRRIVNQSQKSLQREMSQQPLPVTVFLTPAVFVVLSVAVILCGLGCSREKPTETSRGGHVSAEASVLSPQSAGHQCLKLGLDSLTQLTHDRIYSYVDWSAKDVIYAVGGGDIFCLEPDGTNLRNISRTSVRTENTVRSSPDGTRISFLATESGEELPKLFMAASDGSKETRVDVPFPVSHCWSPDGRAMAIFRQGQFIRLLFILDLATGEQHGLLFDVGDSWVSAMDWAGDKIIAENQGAFLIRTAGGGFIQLGFPIRNPEWSKDGDWFLYGIDGDIFIATSNSTRSSDGICKMNLTNSPNAFESHPRLSPDNRWVAFIRDGHIYKASLSCEQTRTAVRPDRKQR